jgi:hypothetical protein
VLLLGRAGSSPLTGFAGWAYHLANGVGFGVFYAVVALGRRVAWAVLWGLVLETATIVTPFADLYGLRGKPHLIAIAYGAHLAYGVPLGLVVRRAAAWRDVRSAPLPPTVALAAVAAGLLAWHQPWRGVADRRPAGSAVLEHRRLVPSWVRLPPGGCVLVRNLDAAPAVLSTDPAAPLASGAVVPVCPAIPRGVVRLTVGGGSFPGGFLLVDGALSRAAPPP